MLFRIHNAIYGTLFTLLGTVIILWLWAEEEAWSIWPLLGACGALVAGIAYLCLAFRRSRTSPTTPPTDAA